jgi:polyisoprenoid-binding protein YceI
MKRVDESTAEVLVFTFKEGLLSAMAHDLKLKVGHFSIELDGQALAATFDPTSLKVVTTRKDGKDAEGLLPTMLYSEIEKNAREDVLNVKKFTSIRFAAVLGQDEVAGQLTLHGTTRPVSCKRSETATHELAETWIDVRDFGIKPYKAMLGTLKVQPRVQVIVQVKK